MLHNSHLPDYRSKEDGVLYIIGNGFDLYHGLNTCYGAFHKWVKDKNPHFADMMEKVYPCTIPQECGYLLWCDFEKALGKNKDLKTLHNLCLEHASDFESLPSNEQQTFASRTIKETLDQISPLLKEWAESFSDKYKDVDKRLPLGTNSKYITFNYTRVLEEVYGIEDGEHIWHIHGSVLDDKIITGYDDTLLSPTVYGSPLEEVSERLILHELEKLRKPTEEIYLHKPRTFNLCGIKTVIVIGHSLADVDMPYFKYMLDDMSKYVDIEWQYWVHNDEAKTKAKERIKQLCADARFEEKMVESKWKYYIMDDWKERERQVAESFKTILIK